MIIRRVALLVWVFVLGSVVESLSLIAMERGLEGGGGRVRGGRRGRRRNRLGFPFLGWVNLGYFKDWGLNERDMGREEGAGSYHLHGRERGSHRIFLISWRIE